MLTRRRCPRYQRMVRRPAGLGWLPAPVSGRVATWRADVGAGGFGWLPGPVSGRVAMAGRCGSPAGFGGSPPRRPAGWRHGEQVRVTGRFGWFPGALDARRMAPRRPHARRIAPRHPYARAPVRPRAVTIARSITTHVMLHCFRVICRNQSWNPPPVIDRAIIKSAGTHQGPTGDADDVPAPPGGCLDDRRTGGG